MAKFLVTQGADVNKANIYNETPLLTAALKGYDELVQFLLEHGVDVDTLYKVAQGGTALHYAAQHVQLLFPN